MPKTQLKAATALLSLGLVTWGCTPPAEGTDVEEAAEATRIPVEILSLSPRPFDERFSASGVIAAEEEVTVSSEIAGRIERIRFEIGDEIRRGQLLLQLDDRSQRARVAKLEAEVARAETDLQWSRRDLERQIELFETAVTAERARDDAQRMVDTSEDNLVSVKADLDIAKVELDQASIRSPLSGRIARRHVAPGEYVTPGAQLFDIVSGASGRSLVEFVFSVSEGDVIGMRPGQQIELAMDAYPQQSFAGEVAAIAPAGSQGTRTFRVELKVESTDEVPLLPGMAGRASVIRRSHDAVFLIPESAVLRDGADSYVWAIAGDAAERRDVRILSQTGTLAVIASDFDPGEGCVVLGQAAVGQGDLVRVRRTHTEPPTSVFD
ncbi:MAG: efflux RND transporter periplasmic adaptor subunit [Acidobacteriota bacterium]